MVIAARREGWWTTVATNGAFAPTPPLGPWRTREEGVEAWQHWEARMGSRAGSYIDMTSARIVGPFRTRIDAFDADISTYPQDIEESWQR